MPPVRLCREVLGYGCNTGKTQPAARGAAALVPGKPPGAALAAEQVSAYRTWVSEIMLQQTRVAAVIPYFQRFMAAYPSVEALAACDEGQLMKLWEGLGYYSRARNLRRAAQIVAEQYGGAFPRTYEELTALPGIGDYTAGAILSIAFGEPVPAVDGNVLRVAARVGGCRLDILDQKNRRQFRRWMEAAMPREAPGAFNQALMDLGAGVCLPNSAPLCDSCPAAAFCAAREQGCQRELPVRAPKKEKRREEKTVFLLLGPEGVALRQRPDTGLLAGLWEYPHVPGRLTEEQAAQQLAHLGPDGPPVAAADGGQAPVHPHPLGHDRLPGAGGGPGAGGLALGRWGDTGPTGGALRL